MDHDNAMLFGADPEQGIVAVELMTATQGPDLMRLFVRDGDRKSFV